MEAFHCQLKASLQEADIPQWTELLLIHTLEIGEGVEENTVHVFPVDIWCYFTHT